MGVKFIEETKTGKDFSGVLAGEVVILPAFGARQGLTLVHFSAQLEPCLTHKNTRHTLNTL